MYCGFSLGLGIALLCMFKSRYTQSFVITLAMLPAVVQIVIMLVNGNIGAGKEEERELKITTPETLDYEGLFAGLFSQYTLSARLEKVKTSNMGTLYELGYRTVLKGGHPSKEFLDAIRCRNGNLNIVCGCPARRHCKAMKQAPEG